MSLLATPTFAGVQESETFYIRTGAPEVSGVSSVQGVSGAVGLTSTDGSITVAVSGQNVNLTTTGNPLAPSTVLASGAVGGASVSASGQVQGATVVATGQSSGATLLTAGTCTAGQFVQSSQLLSSLMPRGCPQSLQGTITFTSPGNNIDVASIGINASALPTINISGTPLLLMMTMSPATRGDFGAGSVPMSLITQWVYPQNDGTYNPITIAGMTAAGTPGTGAILVCLAAGAPDGTMKNLTIQAQLANPSLYTRPFNWSITVIGALPNVAF